MTFAATASVLDPTAISMLLAAIGLSATAGLRAYLPLLAVGIAADVPALVGSGSLIPLQGNFSALSNPLVLIILGALTIGEFTIDKLPVVDHLSDAVHTIIRPLAGAMIMAGTANSLSNTSQWAAAAVGGVLALAFHGVKATTRPAVTATTAGLGNPIVSFIEDVLVVVAVLVLVLAPIIGIILMVLLVIIIGRLLARIVRRFRGRKAGGRPQQAVVVSAAPAPKGGASAPKRGRGRRAQAVPQLPSPVSPAAHAPPVPPVVTGAIVPAAGAALGGAALGGAALGAAAAGAPANTPPNTPTPVPTGPVSPNATTFAGTQQALPYVPPLPAYPPNAPAQGMGLPPQPTQTLPGQGGQAGQAPAQGVYPGDATTLPGTYQGQGQNP